MQAFSLVLYRSKLNIIELNDIEFRYFKTTCKRNKVFKKGLTP